MYCSDWNSHPFTDGHPSRYMDESGTRVPVHFWNISDANKSSIESFPKSIKWKVFRDKKGEGGLEYISLASVEVKIQGKSPASERNKLPPPGTDTSKSTVSTDDLDGMALRPPYYLRNTRKRDRDAFSS